MSRSLLAAPAPTRLWIGTGTDKTGSRGIYRADWDPATGRVGEPVLAAEIPSPTFLARSSDDSHLYALSEIAEGKVSAFRTGPANTLSLLNSQSAEGAGPAHVALHPDGRSLYLANYGGGSITSYVVHADGSLSAPISHFQYGDAGKPSHAHCCTPSPDGRWLLVNDLGLDRILIYRIDAATARLTANEPPYWSSRPKAGPRHTAFHPNRRWVYSVNELDSTVDLLAWDSANGTLQRKAEPVSTLPPDWPAHTAFCSEVIVSPDGKFVYIGNRRNATIAMLPVDQHDGSLTLKQLAPHGGKTARHITLDPTARWLLVADQDSGGIVVLSRNPRTGALSAPLQTRLIGSPQCLVFSS